MEFKTKIYQKLREIDPCQLSTAERAVMHELTQAYKMHTKVTQAQLAQSQRWLGCHPEHEADVAKNKLETTTRKVRQVIRDLRVKHLIPIVSDRHGYTFPRSEKEAQEYVYDLEIRAKAQARAWFETYDAMKKTLDLTSSFFDSIDL